MTLPDELAQIRSVFIDTASNEPVLTSHGFCVIITKPKEGM